jgi:hypothetical protein
LLLAGLVACSGSEEAKRVSLPVATDGVGLELVTNDLGYEVGLTRAAVVADDLQFAIAGEAHTSLLRRLSDRFVASEDPVPFAPTLFGSVRAALGGTRGPQAGLRFAAVAPRPLLHGARSSTFTQLDASLGYLWPRWRVELEVENVLNRDGREGEYHYASYWLGVGPARELPALHYVAGPPLNARLTLTAQY